MTRALGGTGRERTAQRLLKSAAGKFYDPDVDIDWAAPLVNGKYYRAVGIRPRDGVAAALGNPHWRATIAWAGEKIMPFLRESGLVGGPGMPFWRKSFLLSEAV